jgi:hypothetical protein
MIDFTAPLELERHQRAELSDTCNTPGFRWIQKIFEAEIQKFFIALLNMPSGGKEVVEGQRVAKTAAQLYEGAIQRINAEVAYLGEEIRASKPQIPIDLIEGMIDLGPGASTQLAFEEEQELEY